MVDFQKLLTLSLIPNALLALLSLVSIILTAHYWTLTDYFVGRWWMRRSTFAEANKFPIDDVIVDYTQSSTNAMIVSGCLCLAAAVNGIIAFFKLKPNEMDLDYHSPLRRFWSGSAIGFAFVGLCSALTAIILSFTDKGDDEFGCTSTTGKTQAGGVPFTNMMCSREIATCKFMGPIYDKLQAKAKVEIKPWAVTIACNEATVVKWLQLILILNAAVVIGMFAAQAGVRRKTRTKGY